MAEDDGTLEPEETGFPPQVNVRRHIRLRRSQWIGMSLIAAVVIAALAGAFGETRSRTSGAVDGLRVDLEQPARFRYQMVEAVSVRVTNTSAAVLDTVTVAFDSTYLNRFSGVSIVPAASEAWVVELIDVEPGETRLVVAEIQAEQYWRHTGELAVTAAGLDTVRLALSTLALP